LNQIIATDDAKELDGFIAGVDGVN